MLGKKLQFFAFTTLGGHANYSSAYPPFLLRVYISNSKKCKKQFGIALQQRERDRQPEGNDD